tara:strand:+ start:707 stop:1249 length:543 start_codon:yes stop_codon:yes gene_type:complete
LNPTPVTKVDLFTIEAFKISIEEWKTEGDRIMDMIPFNDPQWSTVEPHISYTDYFNKGEIVYKDSFLEIVTPYLNDFLSWSEYKFSRVNGFWCQKYKARDYHVPHTHGPIGYSCVFYARLKESHRGTMFFSPFANHLGDEPTNSILVEEGDLIIFPSNLLHMAPPHDSEDERVIISFNLI